MQKITTKNDTKNYEKIARNFGSIFFYRKKPFSKVFLMSKLV